MMTLAAITTRVLEGFHDPACSSDHWDKLLEQSDTDAVFLTRPWLQAWWETVGTGKLLLIAAEREGQVIALAPLYAIEGMVFFLGAGESDYYDFIGRTDDPEVLAALLFTARQHTPNFLGFKLHIVPDRSRTGRSLQEAAVRLGLVCHDEGELPTIEVDLAGQADAVREAVGRSMLKREEYCRRHGKLEIQHLREVSEIRPHLAEYYAQHLARWQVKGLPSPFSDLHVRAFLERFLELAEPTGCVRFLRINWNDRPFAFEFAWYYRGTHYSAPWCFAVEYANQSPGHILLRQSILAALAEGLDRYDLGAGDQEYKFRLPARAHLCRTWGLYPADA